MEIDHIEGELAVMLVANEQIAGVQVVMPDTGSDLNDELMAATP